MGFVSVATISLSVNAKQLERPALQAGPSRCESDHGHFKCIVKSEECRTNPRDAVGPSSGILHFAFFIMHLDGPRSSDRSERRSAKAEAAGAIPAVDTISQDCGVTSSISPCEGDGSGANPGFLTNLLSTFAGLNISVMKGA